MDGLIIKTKVGAKVFNEEESLSSISGKEIGLKAYMEGRQGQNCMVCSSKFEILLEKHKILAGVSQMNSKLVMEEETLWFN